MISVVIVNYNAGHLLAECIASALPQVGEVLVVDNASRDTSMQDCARQFAGDARVQLILNTANHGFAAACNMGYVRASGDTVLFLNPDCRLEPAAVALLADALHGNPTVGMVGGLLMNLDGSEQGGGGAPFLRPGDLLCGRLG